jgi:hypothetical protein
LKSRRKEKDYWLSLFSLYVFVMEFVTVFFPYRSPFLLGLFHSLSASVVTAAGACRGRKLIKSLDE